MMLVEISLDVKNKSPDMITKKIRRRFAIAKVALFLMITSVVLYMVLLLETTNLVKSMYI